MKLHVARSREIVELVALGLLVERPRHPYDMLRQVKMRGNTELVPGMPRSLYTAVERLAADGFVQAGETVREGTRPERTVFAVTDEGRDEFVFRLQEMLAQPSDRTTFHAALSLVAGIPRDTALFSLKQRAAAVEGEVASIDTMLAGALEQLPRLVLIEVEYLRSQLDAEARWVRALIADIESGELSWELPWDMPGSEEQPPPGAA